MTFRLLIAAAAMLPLFASEGAEQQVQVTTTERINFAPAA
jgi:hypothetical protein